MRKKTLKEFTMILNKETKKFKLKAKNQLNLNTKVR